MRVPTLRATFAELEYLHISPRNHPAPETFHHRSSPAHCRGRDASSAAPRIPASLRPGPPSSFVVVRLYHNQPRKAHSCHQSLSPQSFPSCLFRHLCRWYVQPLCLYSKARRGGWRVAADVRYSDSLPGYCAA